MRQLTLYCRLTIPALFLLSLCLHHARIHTIKISYGQLRHECWKLTNGEHRFKECRYLEAINDGGLPSTSQFQLVKQIFSKNHGKDTAVILKHLGHIRDRLNQTSLVGDDRKQKYYDEVTNMFNILAGENKKKNLKFQVLKFCNHNFESIYIYVYISVLFC